MLKKQPVQVITLLLFTLTITLMLLQACSDSPNPTDKTGQAAQSTSVATTPASTNGAGMTSAVTPPPLSPITPIPDYSPSANIGSTTGSTVVTPFTTLTTVTPVETGPSPAVTTATSRPARTGNGKIVYNVPDGTIYVINPDGTDKTRIATGYSPIFSPDGHHIAFVADDPNATSIIVRQVNLDGSGQQDLCESHANVMPQLIRWSPGGRYIALMFVQPENRPAYIFLCSIADKSLTPITRPQGTPLALYDWSPDGNFAVWEVKEKEGYNLYYGEPDKNTTNSKLFLKGENPPTSASGGAEFLSARFDPEGKTLAVATHTPRGDKISFYSVPGHKSSLAGQSFIINSDSTVNFVGCSWSPDSQTMLVTVFDQRGISSLRLFQLTSSQFGKQTKVLINSAVSSEWSRQ